MNRPTADRLAQMLHLLDEWGLHTIGEDFKAEIDALRQELAQLRGVIESQKHVGNEERRLAARERELETALHYYCPHGDRTACIECWNDRNEQLASPQRSA